MSAAESTLQADLTTPDPDRKKINEEIAEEFEIRRQVESGDLWAQKMDFRQVCSCHDCVIKIETLNEFEKELKAKMILLYQCISRLDFSKQLCGRICLGALTMKDILILLEKKLETISSEKSATLGKSTSDNDNLKELYREIVKKLRSHDLFGRRGNGYPDHDDDSSTDEDVDDQSIIQKTVAARYYFNKTQVQDDVYVLLEEIKNIEKDWDNNTADANKLEKLIKDLRKFPAQKAKAEVEELIKYILERRNQKLNFEKARKCIYTASYHCIRKAKEFFKRFPLPTEVNKHDVMKETLVSLITVVNKFENKWEDEFARVFTSYDRSDPKRQKQLVE